VTFDAGRSGGVGGVLPYPQGGSLFQSLSGEERRGRSSRATWGGAPPQDIKPAGRKTLTARSAPNTVEHELCGRRGVTREDNSATCERPEARRGRLGRL